MKKIALLIMMTIGLTASAQQYSTALGVKFGYPGYGAFNVKHFMGANAIEGSIGGGPRHLWVQALYERNYGIDGGLEWYWGLGGDLGFWNRGYPYHYHPKYHDYYYFNSGAWGGLDAVLGLEYTFNEIPLNLAVDFGPTIRLFPYVGFGWFGGAFAIRYAIK